MSKNSKGRSAARKRAHVVSLGGKTPRRTVEGTPLNLAGAQVQKHGDVITRVKNCDMVGDLFSNQDWGVEGFRVNPGNTLLFPRLSQVAKVFEKYRFKSLKFMYFPISAATRTGSVVLFLETDIKDAAPTTKEEMLNHYNSRRCSPWTQCVLDVAKRDLTPRPQMFVRDTSLPTTDTDQRLDDLGKLYIGHSIDLVDLSSIGEIWVEYDIELISPSVPAGAEVTANIFTEYSSAPAGASPTSLNQALEVTDRSTWDDFLSFRIVSGLGEELMSFVPAEAQLRQVFENLAGSGTTWATTPAITAFNGGVVRGSTASGDHVAQVDGDGGYSILEDAISLPGTLLSGNTIAADLLNLPRISITTPTLSAGLVRGLILSLLPVASGIASAKPPPAARFSRSRRRMVELLVQGRFHKGEHDLVCHHRGSYYLTGRGLVPSIAPIRYLALKETPGEPQPTSSTTPPLPPQPVSAQPLCRARYWEDPAILSR